MTKAMVTGSSGFIGRRVIQKLTEMNSSISLVDDEYFLTADWRSTLYQTLDAENPDVIYHVGACSNTLESDVQYMMTRNYESTKVIMDWCVSKNRKLIYSSSAANYGESGQYPSNLYGWSKYAAEDYVIKSGGIALRYFNVYGPGEQDKGRMASFLFQAFTKSLNHESIQIFPGKPQRDFVYINDVVSANLFAYKEYNEQRGRYYEVSTGVASTFEEKLEIFGLSHEYTDEDKIPKGYQFYTCGNPAKWLNGWKPEFPLKKGVLDYQLFLEKSFSN
jgi:ADP-L-glycero-D-manno-heptose 6-epimerase